MFSVLSDPSCQSQVPREAVWLGLWGHQLFSPMDVCGSWSAVCFAARCSYWFPAEESDHGSDYSRTISNIPPEPSGIDFPLSFLGLEGGGWEPWRKGNAESLLSAAADWGGTCFCHIHHDNTEIRRKCALPCHIRIHYIWQCLTYKSWHSGGHGAKITKYLSIVWALHEQLNKPCLYIREKRHDFSDLLCVSSLVLPFC